MYIFFFYLKVGPSIICGDDTLRGQKRESDPLKLELETVVSHHVRTEKRTWIRSRIASAFKY